MKRQILIAAFILTAGTLAAQNYIIVNSEKVFKSIDAYNTAISDLDKLAKQYQDHPGTSAGDYRGRTHHGRHGAGGCAHHAQRQRNTGG